LPVRKLLSSTYSGRRIHPKHNFKFSDASTKSIYTPLIDVYIVYSMEHAYLDFLNLVFLFWCWLCTQKFPHPDLHEITLQDHRTDVSSVYVGSAVMVGGSAGFWAPHLVQGDPKICWVKSSSQMQW
jgi:hypothetical protein